ncbi:MULTISPECIES: hypothetical protein [Symbiopectobacterium]|uniref:hypothetical protein n=1 Tax=Symbiopectobacterium TaxID=801 RepID=UPI001A2CF717|nr:MULTISPECIES: hypothetical protein [Symbiopectobacterium]MBG6248991.1 hypothetical protein [Candidatus Symbiopectobacterium sp. PLON1]MBT9429207.1 hypothetical protein [Candidatus Symbiopectobacterium endolongispinus]
MAVGLGGRKRKTALSVLKEVDGFTKASAEKLLSEYRFQEKGLFNDYVFALEIEQTGKIPPWAKRLKKRLSPRAMDIKNYGYHYLNEARFP